MTHIEVLKEIYAALNRNDIPGILKFSDPQIERTEFLDTPAGGSFHGIAEFEEHLVQGRSTWAEGSCNPEEFILADDKVIVLVYVKVKLKKNLEWVEGRVADGFAFKNGKVTQMHSFTKKEQALEWAGVEK